MYIKHRQYQTVWCSVRVESNFTRKPASSRPPLIYNLSICLELNIIIIYFIRFIISNLSMKAKFNF